MAAQSLGGTQLDSALACVHSVRYVVVLGAEVMGNCVTILGLTSSSFAAIWLAGLEIRARDRAARRRKSIESLTGYLRACTEVHESTIATYADIAARLRGTQPYDVEAETRHTREQIAELKCKLQKLEDPDRQIEEIMEPVDWQLWALAMLSVGFVLQLLGTLWPAPQH